MGRAIRLRRRVLAASRSSPSVSMLRTNVQSELNDFSEEARKLVRETEPTWGGYEEAIATALSSAYERGRSETQGKNMIFTLAYVFTIALVNWGFHVVPLWHGWPPMSLVVGAVFVLRDFAQRESGHRVLAAMLAGALLSWWMADAFVALASLTAFAISEGAEYAIYTFTKRSFAQRVLWSTALSTPLDSAVFLAMIGHLSLWGVVAMTASKMLGAFIIWKAVQYRTSTEGI